MNDARWGAIFAALSLPLLCGVACSLTNLDGYADGQVDAGADHHVATSSSGALVDGGAGGAEAGSPAGADAAVTNPYREAVLADKPIAYFPLDEAAGARTAHEVMTGKIGDVTGDLAFGVPAVAGSGVHSLGNGQIDFGQILTFTGQQAWTFEAWVFPDVSDGNTFYEYFNKRDGTTNGLVIYVRSENGVTAQLEDDWDTGGRGVSIALPPLDHFIHIVFTYSPDTGVRPWADGVKGDPGYADPGGPTVTATTCKIIDGLRGAIDEIAVYDHALSDDRVASHYAAGLKSQGK